MDALQERLREMEMRNPSLDKHPQGRLKELQNYFRFLYRDFRGIVERVPKRSYVHGPFSDEELDERTRLACQREVLAGYPFSRTPTTAQIIDDVKSSFNDLCFPGSGLFWTTGVDRLQNAAELGIDIKRGVPSGTNDSQYGEVIVLDRGRVVYRQGVEQVVTREVVGKVISGETSYDCISVVLADYTLAHIHRTTEDWIQRYRIEAVLENLARDREQEAETLISRLKASRTNATFIEKKQNS